MKKNLFIFPSMVALLIVLISACSQKTEYTNAIPSDATQVIAINLKSLADKAGIGDKENREAIQKFIGAMKSGMNASAFQQLEIIVKDPSKLGIDIDSPIYLFRSPSFNNTTLLAKINNEDDLKKLLEATQKEQINTPITESEGYSFVKVDEEFLLAFNASTLLAVSYNKASELESIQMKIPSLLKQTEENSIVGAAIFKKMRKMDGDITMFASPNSMLDTYAKQAFNAMPQYAILDKMMFLGSLSFEKGKIELEIENHTESAELKALIEKQEKSTSPIENTFLKYFPKSTISLFSVGVNGEELYNALQENELFGKSLSITEAPEIKNLFSAFQNDLTVGIVNITMNKTPSFLAYASIKNDDAIKAIYEKRAQLVLRRGDEIVKLNENDYVYKSREMNVFFGIHNKQLYATNNELLYKNIGKTVEPSVKDTEYASGIKGKRVAFVINTAAILELPIVKVLTTLGGAEYATYYSLANNVSYLEAVGNTDKTTITLQLKDQKVNSLKQIVNFVKEFAGM